MEVFRVQEILYKLYNEVNELSKESDSNMNSFSDFILLQFLKENNVVPQPTPD